MSTKRHLRILRKGIPVQGGQLEIWKNTDFQNGLFFTKENGGVLQLGLLPNCSYMQEGNRNITAEPIFIFQSVEIGKSGNKLSIEIQHENETSLVRFEESELLENFSSLITMAITKTEISINTEKGEFVADFNYENTVESFILIDTMLKNTSGLKIKKEEKVVGMKTVVDLPEIKDNSRKATGMTETIGMKPVNKPTSPVIK